MRLSLQAASLKSRPPDPVFPPHKSKFQWKCLPVDYSKDFPPEVWREMARNPFPVTPQPWIDPEAVCAVAEMSSFPDMKEVKAVAEILSQGADTGVRGSARLPQEAKNSQKVQELGPQVLDTIRDWLDKVSILEKEGRNIRKHHVLFCFGFHSPDSLSCQPSKPNSSLICPAWPGADVRTL